MYEYTYASIFVFRKMMYRQKQFYYQLRGYRREPVYSWSYASIAAMPKVLFTGGQGLIKKNFPLQRFASTFGECYKYIIILLRFIM